MHVCKQPVCVSLSECYTVCEMTVELPYSGKFSRCIIFTFFNDQPPTLKLMHAKMFIYAPLGMTYMYSIRFPLNFENTVNPEAQVPVLLFRDCTCARYGLRGVLIIMGYFSTSNMIACTTTL